MRRSSLLLVLGLIFGCECSAAQVASTRTYRVGYLNHSTAAGAATHIEAFRQALRDLGYVEGRNLSLEIRNTEGDADRARTLAAELVSLHVDVVVARSVVTVVALKEASSTLPIVIAGTDPVASGLVTSLARPGGNITGVAGSPPDLRQRQLQLLTEAVPGASKIAFLFEATAGQVDEYKSARDAAPTLRIDLEGYEVRTVADFPGAFAAIQGAHPQAILVPGTPLTSTERPQILEFVAAHRLPSMFSGNREFVDGGGLLFYDAHRLELFRRAASYVDRILKGAKPADLPIETPSKYELIINMKTAKALGLTIPPSVLAQATELIQ